MRESLCRMLDEFGAEIEHADSRLDATMKKMAKVLHLSDGKTVHITFIVQVFQQCYLDRRQWMAIGALSSALLVVLFMLVLM